MAARSWWMTALVALTAGCSAALTPLTPEQTTGLKEAQRIADQVTKAYPRLLTGNALMKLRAVIADKERAANHRGVEILVRFLGLTEREALEGYAAYLIEANRNRNGRNVLIPFGHPLPCVQLRDLWTSFGQTAPACEAWTDPPKITECPYDDWMSTGCKAGEPLE